MILPLSIFVENETNSILIGKHGIGYPTVCSLWTFSRYPFCGLLHVPLRSGNHPADLGSTSDSSEGLHPSWGKKSGSSLVSPGTVSVVSLHDRRMYCAKDYRIMLPILFRLFICF